VLEDITRRAKSLKPLQSKNQYGSFIPYTRHNSECLLKGGCHCPKWVYFRQKRAGSGGKSLKVSDR
jgi:hypothetical protein